MRHNLGAGKAAAKPSTHSLTQTRVYRTRVRSVRAEKSEKPEGWLTCDSVTFTVSVFTNLREGGFGPSSSTHGITDCDYFEERPLYSRR